MIELSVPSQEEQTRILYTITTGDYTYYENLKNTLVEKGAFKDIADIDKQVTELIEKVTYLDAEQKDRFDIERD